MTSPILLLFLLIVNVAISGFAQDVALSVSGDIEAIKNIHREFELHTARKENLMQERDRITQTLKATEAEFQNLANDKIQKQMTMFMLEWEQATLENSIAGRRSPRSESVLNVERNLVDQATLGIDLQQIDGAARVVVQRRLKTFQDGAKWKEDFAKWTRERPGFFYRYWRFTDPSLVYSRVECESFLETLNAHSNENLPASLAAAFLELRLGRTKSADKTIDKVVAMKTSLQSMALAARAIAFACEGDFKKARVEIGSSLKLDPSNAHVRFLRARIAASQRDWTNAEQDLKVVQKIADLSIDATRNLAVIQALKAEKNEKLVGKIVEQTKMLRALAGENDWQAALLTGWVHKIANEKEQALNATQKAETLASGDNQPLCRDLHQAIVDDEPFEWNFLRR